MSLPPTLRLQALHLQALRPLGQALLNALYPPLCLRCKVPVTAQGTLCQDCFTELDFITQPYCHCCGLPFEVISPGQDQPLCGQCLARAPHYDQARAVMVYGPASRDMMLAFKHGDRTELAKTFGTWLARVAKEFSLDSDVIIPVPLHRRRLLRRRYNQSALLAQALSRLLHKPVLTDLLRRHRATPAQQGNRAKRARNVRGAFVINTKKHPNLQGLSVLLIDDVFTTGATVENCAAMLKRAGVKQVNVLTLARVMR